MDTTALTRIRELTESITADIRQWNEQRISSRYQIIDIEVEQKAQDKASKLLLEQIQNSQRLQKLERERAKILRDTVDYFKQFLFWTGINLSRTTPALVILVVCGALSWGLGVFIGLNILPSTVGCPSTSSPCYQWRLNKESTIAPDRTAPKQQNVPIKKRPPKK